MKKSFAYLAAVLLLPQQGFQCFQVAFDNNDILDGDRNGTGILDDGMTNNGNGSHVGGTVSPSPSASTKPSANPNK